MRLHAGSYTSFPFACDWPQCTVKDTECHVKDPNTLQSVEQQFGKNALVSKIADEKCASSIWINYNENVARQTKSKILKDKQSQNTQLCQAKFSSEEGSMLPKLKLKGLAINSTELLQLKWKYIILVIYTRPCLHWANWRQCFMRLSCYWSWILS